MPLIGIYRGRDKTDTVFGQAYQLTPVPFGMNADGAIPIFSPNLTTEIEMVMSIQFSDTFGDPNSSAIAPVGVMQSQFSDTFGDPSSSAVAPIGVMQGGT